MHVGTLYDLLAPLYQRVVVPLHDLAITRAVERTLGGWPASILEVGIGPGRGVAQLGGPERRVVGVDLSRGMLGLAGAHLKTEHVNASLVRASVVRLPFRSGAFDAVMSTFLLDLLTKAELPFAVAELARVVSPGGRLVLGLMEFPNKLTERAWMTAYRALPDLVGRCRPIDLSPYLTNQPLRVTREEEVKGWIGMKVVTMVKTES